MHANGDILRCRIADNLDDGNELMDVLWFESGFGVIENNSIIYLGHLYEITYDAAIRYVFDWNEPPEDIVYARILFPSFGGQLSGPLSLLVTGIVLEDIGPFSQYNRPSMMPRTQNVLQWTIEDAWLSGSDTAPLYYSSPDIASIIKELLAYQGGGCHEIGIAFDAIASTNEISMLYFEDACRYGLIDQYDCATLELYTNLCDTIVCPGLLGKPTDRSAVFNMESLVDLDAYVEYGTTAGSYDYRTVDYFNNPGGRAFEMMIDGLTPDTEYYYRVAYRRAGTMEYEYSPEQSFHTQRSRDSSFRFVVEADEHLGESMTLPPDLRKQELYNIAMNNIRTADPDWFISLGDYATVKNAYRDIVSYQEARDYYSRQRTYTDIVGVSSFFFLAVGNHEAECGWYYDSESAGVNNNIAIWSTLARQEYIPNPIPNDFYTGSDIYIPEFGLREDYYAWEWGNALMIVLSPYWYTTTMPREALDNWAWTLGRPQYEWLHDTLYNARSRWIFIFIHQLVSSCENPYVPGAMYYGRGGIEIAKYKVDERPSYEWGGEDKDGNYVFCEQRPYWHHGSIHDMLVRYGVNIVFHGHDHVYAKQDLDGIVYLACPALADPEYSFGFRDAAQYQNGTILENSGHIEVDVSRHRIAVRYVRAYRPDDGENGSIAHNFTIVKPIIDTPRNTMHSQETMQVIMP